MPVQTYTRLKRSWKPVRAVEMSIKKGHLETHEVVAAFEEIIRNKQCLAPKTIEPKLYAIIEAVKKAPADLGFNYFSSLYHACFQRLAIYEQDKNKGRIRGKMYNKLQDAAEERMIELTTGKRPHIVPSPIPGVSIQLSLFPTR